MNELKLKMINSQVRNIRAKDRIDKLRQRVKRELDVLSHTETVRRENLSILREHKSTHRRLSEVFQATSWQDIVLKFQDVMRQSTYLHQNIESILFTEAKLRSNYEELRRQLDELKGQEANPVERSFLRNKQEVRGSIGDGGKLAGKGASTELVFKCANNLASILHQINRIDNYSRLSAKVTFSFHTPESVSIPRLVSLCLVLEKKLTAAYQFSTQRRSIKYAVRRLSRLPSNPISQSTPTSPEEKRLLKTVLSHHFVGMSPSFQSFQALVGSYAAMVQRDVLGLHNDQKGGRDTKPVKRDWQNESVLKGLEQVDRTESDYFQREKSIAKNKKSLSLPHMDVKPGQITVSSAKVSPLHDRQSEELKDYVTCRKRDLLRAEPNEIFHEFLRELEIRKRGLQRFINTSGGTPMQPKRVKRIFRLPLTRQKRTASSLPTACTSPHQPESRGKPWGFKGRSHAERLEMLFGPR